MKESNIDIKRRDTTYEKMEMMTYEELEAKTYKELQDEFYQTPIPKTVTIRLTEPIREVIVNG